MRFTFTATKATKINGESGYDFVVKRDGVVVTYGWIAGNRREALHEARIAAETYGYIDGE